MQDGSSSGVRVFRDEPELIERALVEHVASLRQRHPEIKRVVWFGSRVSGRPTRSSDVDLCLILERSSRPFLDRIPEFLPDRFPVSIDIFPYTREEFLKLAETSPSWHREIDLGRDL